MIGNLLALSVTINCVYMYMYIYFLLLTLIYYSKLFSSDFLQLVSQALTNCPLDFTLWLFINAWEKSVYMNDTVVQLF